MSPEKLDGLLAKVLSTDGSVAEEEARTAAVLYAKHVGEEIARVREDIARTRREVHEANRQIEIARNQTRQAVETAKIWQETSEAWRRKAEARLPEQVDTILGAMLKKRGDATIAGRSTPCRKHDRPYCIACHVDYYR